MIKILCLLCVLCLEVGVAVGAASSRDASVLSSEPEGASVFHYLRGAYYFLGYTPLGITKDDLDGKEETRILLVKYGYNRSLVDFTLDGKNQMYKLNPAGQPYLLTEEGVNSKYSACRSKVGETIQNTISQGNRSQIEFQLPLRWAEDGGKRKLIVLANLLNHDDIIAIGKAERRDKEEAFALVEKFLSPVIKPLINQFRQLECLEYLLLIVTHSGKRQKMDITPYRDYWTATTSMVIGNTKIITTAIGSTVELQKDMVVIKNEKTFLFEFKLN
jgi:hypothetical protein